MIINNRSVINFDELPPQYPTHMHTKQFWEQLGRVIATYGFLEDALGRAIFAFTATTKYSQDEIALAYQAWLPKLKKGLTETLYNLSVEYQKAVHNNSQATISNIEELINDIQYYAKIRNVLCHGSWPPPNSKGESTPFFVNKNMEIWVGAIDINYLKHVQEAVKGLICSIINSVTHMGWQFPGGAGFGQAIF